MKNQFFYTRKVKSPVQKDGVDQFTEYTDSFNLDLVIRSMEKEDKTLIVLLNDAHERLEDAPQFDKTRTKIVGYTKQRNTFQSEIILSIEDSKRFKALTSID